MSLESKMRTENGVSILAINGRLNIGTNLTFLEIELKKAIAGGLRKLVMDVSGLEYVDSAGIGMLMNAWGLMDKEGGRLVIAGAHGVVAESFGIVHLQKVVGLYGTVGEAVASY